ncbi:hypothetical protein QJS83_10470 [Bdellovibrio sp. 22V]|uniref:hypothetical protein n=1 Tax=Bdellovibrio TaxID=958 RepID=UPI002542F844|nr:hypothetical protein [Bdellovibrio sp. 22V]WII70884.1 hypothetical protein QJS83_10470 [Bdellovibrio sp. 22V]
MKSKLLVLSALLSVGLFASISEARSTGGGVMLTANAFMRNTTSKVGSGSESESKVSTYDLKLGYLGGSGLYLGGIYSISKTEGSGASTDGKALGGSIGYVGASGFYVQGHYLAQAEYGDWKEGTGFQGDFGYITNVTGAFIVGVELSYRAIEYKKDETDASVSSIKTSELMPLLTVGFIF